MNDKKCGAKSRSNNGRPCKLPPMKNGRCRFHGGKTPIKHGYYTKSAKEERKAFRAMVRLHLQTLQYMEEK